MKIVCGEVYVVLNALFFLHLIDELLKILLSDFHNYVREHLDESSVAVPSPTGVAGLLCNYVYNVLVKTEVENGIHHTGH